MEMTKMYEKVFEDCVRNYLENAEENKRNLSEEDIQHIAYQLVYKNEYIWEVINETIYYYIEYLEKGGNNNE